MQSAVQRIPVTLFTGFLGAGKTTLLNDLISDPEAGRVAVIINEFGEVGLDHDLIEESTEETLLLPSGCLCCSIRGDLLKALEKLIARRSRGELAFDRVVIETTGIADPAPILHSLVVDQIVGPHFQMDGVVTVADAAAGLQTLQAQFEAVNQVAMADLIVLSKTDLVTPSDVARFEKRLAEINTSARRITANHGRVAAGTLFGLSAMRPGVTSDDISMWLGTSTSSQDMLVGVSGLSTAKSAPAAFTVDPSPSAQRPAHRVSSASIEVHEPISATVFDFWLDTLIALKGKDVLRIKGIVHVEGVGLPFVFHGVQHIFEPPVLLENWAGKDTTSRVVVIARDVSEEELKSSLKTLYMRSTEEDTSMRGMMAQSAEIPF